MPATSFAAVAARPELSRYRTTVAVLAALLTILDLAVRLVAVPLALAGLLAERAARRLDRWLAALPLPPEPVRATAYRVPVAVGGAR